MQYQALWKMEVLSYSADLKKGEIMFVCVQTVIIVGIFAMMSKAERCAISINDSTGFRCIAEDSFNEVSAKDCHNTMHCCLSSGICYAKPRKSPHKLQPDKNDKQMIEEMRDIVKTANLQETVTDRNPFPYPPLPFGGEVPYPGFSVLPTFVCRGRPHFPENCNMDPKNARYIENPPINIPYCLRIQCDPNNPELDLKPAECRSIPGCYFDKRLSDLRIHFGNSVLPGVPVCHLAIRNSVFQEEANKVVGNNKTWSPYLTECLLKRFDEVIRAPKEGCRELRLLEYFKHKAQMAAWEGINAYGCVLMNACWTQGGCFFPVDISNLTLSFKSPVKEEYVEEIEYGKTKCQNFDDSTPKNALESYHTCLISGCKLSIQAKSAYYNYLFDFGEKMSVADHWKFWRKVKSGEIGAHNIEEFRLVPQKHTDITSFSLVIRYPPNNSTPNLLSEILSPNSAAVLDILKSTLGIQNSNQRSPDTSSLFAQIRGFQMPCSLMFTSLGSRPCSPSPRQSEVKHCPYKPVTVKRFKPLKGSFKGCCQTNLCYLPRKEVRTARSGAAIYYSEWSYWTECSASCGSGTKRRWRNCIGIDKSRCTLALSERENCEIRKCTLWSNWGPWSLCSVSCMGGIISRSRSCLPSGDYCVGPKEQVRSCNTGYCGVGYGHWSSWIGSCEPCGKTVYRSRECRKKICAQTELFETKRCPTRCGSWTIWSSYGQCKFDFVENACQRVRRRECINEENKPSLCHGDSQEYQKCDVC